MGKRARLAIAALGGLGALAVATACGALLPTKDGDDPAPGPSVEAGGGGGDGGTDAPDRGDADTTAPVDPTAEPPDASTTDAAATDAQSPTGHVWQCLYRANGPYAKLTECEAARNACGEPRPDAVELAPCTIPGEEIMTCGPCKDLKFYSKNCTCN